MILVGIKETFSTPIESRVMNTESNTEKPNPAPAAMGESGNSPLPSQAILQGRNEVRIAHSGCVYSLRVTRQGKLILTK